MYENQQLIDRVQQALKRLGYSQIDAEHLGEGKVLLSGKIGSFDERAIMVAAVRTVSGVTSVALRLNL
jgi:osmotically-inducible protein OsmY